MNKLAFLRSHLGSVLIVLGFCAVLIWLLSGTSESNEENYSSPPVLLVTVMDMHPVKANINVQAQGLSQARWPTSVTATVSGRVQFIREELVPGALVPEDSVLVKLQDEPYRAALAQAIAQVAEAELQLAKTQNEQFVVKELNNASSAFGRREPHIKSAQAQLSATQAAVTNAEQQLANAIIAAPFASVLMSEHISPGQWINSGEELFRIASSESVDVNVELSAQKWQRLSHINERSLITVVAPDGKPWLAKLRYLSPVMSATTRQRSVVLSVFSPYQDKQPLLPDQQVTVHFQGPQLSNVVRAPASVLTEDGKVWNVIEGTLVQENIELLEETAEEVLFRFEQAPERSRAVVLYPLSSMLSGQRVTLRTDTNTLVEQES